MLYKAKQIAVIFSLGAMLMACGFSAVYEKGSEGLPVIASIKISEALLGGILDEEIRARSKRGADGYNLVIGLSEEINEENIGLDREASRRSVKIVLNYQIISNDGLTKQSGTIQQSDVFSASTSEFTNRSEVEQARNTVLRLLARDVIQLLVHRNRMKN